MARTTIDLDAPILNEIRAIQKREGRSMGKIVSQLLAEALIKQKTSAKTPKFKWISRPMRTHEDLADKEEVYRILDRDPK
ncbi:MAG: hypothetical protein ACQ9MH_25300 [Nitrospinales bacterium]